MKKKFWQDKVLPPISFRYDGKPSPEFIPEWKAEERSEKALEGIVREITFADPKTGLTVISHIREYDSSPPGEFHSFDAVDWVLEFVNNDKKDTPIISDILPLDITWDCSKEEKIFLHQAKGSLCRMDDFLPITEQIHPNQNFSLKPIGGRSSNGVLPFMNLQKTGGGLVLAIGWSGQWLAAFDRGETTFRATGGMEKTHLLLRPGERIRTPRILLIEWEGNDPIIGNNLLRQIILRYYTPKSGSGLAIPPVALSTQASYYLTQKDSEPLELESVERGKRVGVEVHWVDACWYGSGGGWWWQEVGNWNIRQDFFPNGLKPISDAVHNAGLKFLLWFEPERVLKGTRTDKEHPEFLLHVEVDPNNRLFNLGLPEARAYLTNLLSEIITSQGIDIYRQDFNFEPLPYWQANDKTDRVGMSEIRHIEGLYRMWDELRQRHPGLLIDNCSSGGRRIDLETISRSFPLWRSDFSDFSGPTYGRGLQIGDQIQTAGLSRWVPLHTAGVWTFTPYDFRSAMSTGVVLYGDVRRADFPEEEAKKAIAELKRLRPYLLGNFYPLIPLTLADHDWCAYQYHRPDLQAGIALFFRRHESPFPTMEVSLQAIEPEAHYEVGLTDTFDDPPRKAMSGADLSRIKITIPEAPGSILLLYSLKSAP